MHTRMVGKVCTVMSIRDAMRSTFLFGGQVKLPTKQVTDCLVKLSYQPLAAVNKYRSRPSQEFQNEEGEKIIENEEAFPVLPSETSCSSVPARTSLWSLSIGLGCHPPPPRRQHSVLRSSSDLQKGA